MLRARHTMVSLSLLITLASPGPADAASWNPATCQMEDDGSSRGLGDLGLQSETFTIPSGEITVYSPTILPGSSCTFPLIVWGNGTSATGGAAYPGYFEQLASHGFVVAAHHTNLTLSGTPLLDAAAFMMTLSDDPSSPFHQRIAPGYGLMGKSQGAYAASRDVGADADAIAAVMIAGSVNGMTKPGLWATGDLDFLQTATRTGYDTATGPGVYAEAAGGVDHMGMNTHLGTIELSTSFMRCHLRGDANTCDYIRCDSCQTEPWGVFEAREAVPVAVPSSGGFGLASLVCALGAAAIRWTYRRAPFANG